MKKTLLSLLLIFCFAVAGVNAQSPAQSSVPPSSTEALVLLVDHNTMIITFLAILFAIFMVLICVTGYTKRKHRQ